MAHRRTSGQRSTSTAECHRQTPNEGALPDGADDPDEQWPGHRHNNTSQARPFHQASRNEVNDKVSPKSQTSRQTIDKPAAQSVTHSAKSGNKSMLSAKEEHIADMMPCGFEAMCQFTGCTRKSAEHGKATCIDKLHTDAVHRDNRFGIPRAMDQLWNQFNKDRSLPGNEKHSKGQALLDYMWQNKVDRGGAKHKVRWHFPEHDEVCQNCWARTAGFYDKKTSDVNSTFRTQRAAFNAGSDIAGQGQLGSGQLGSGQGAAMSGEQRNAQKAVQVCSFLKRWMQEAQDLIPESDDDEEDMRVDYDEPLGSGNIAGKKQRVHVDVTLKKDIFLACVDDMRDELTAAGEDFNEKEYGFPVSETYFLKLLREHYKVIMHKHKGFSKCNCCHYYKEQLKKKGSVIDRIKLKKERAQHYALIYAERVEYHTLRRHAQEHPDKVISMIVDSCSKWKTELPRYTRELKVGNFSAHGNSLCTCLVHQNKGDVRNPGGAFNYFIEDAVKGGGNITAEVIWRTLCKLQDMREIWAEELHVQLDNTTKDNKNHTVFAFLAWLVQSGNFHKVTVSFLPVGHTHEDIDALFGVIVRFLRGVPVTYTHEELRKQVHAALREGKKTSWHPSELPEVVRGTHDWGRWFNKAPTEQDVCPGGPVPMRQMSHFALLNVPDNQRPHRFEFSQPKLSDGSKIVVMDYFWWCSSATKWNKVSEPVFNCVPNMENIKPARLDEEKKEAVKRCKAANWNCKVKNCGCCGIWAAFTDTNSYKPSDTVEGGAERVEEMKAEWIKTFEATTNQGAAESLPGGFHVC